MNELDVDVASSQNVDASSCSHGSQLAAHKVELHNKNPNCDMKLLRFTSL